MNQLDRLEITVRIHRTLAQAGITSLDALVEMTEEDLLRVPGFGRKSLADLRSATREIHAEYSFRDW